MKLPRRQFLHLAAGAAALPACPAIRAGASLSDRGRCASSSPFAAGGATDIVARLMGQWLSERLGQQFVDREPAGRRRQYRHRGGRARTAGRLHAAPGRRGERDQRDALRQAQFQFHPRYRAGGGHHPHAPTSWWSIHRFRPRRFPSSSPMPRPIPARSIWRRPASEPLPISPASCSR